MKLSQVPARGGGPVACAALAERLEIRRFLSFQVSNTDDDGSETGTLRWAIAQANSAGGDQTIDFSSDLTASNPVTIVLSNGVLELNDTSGTVQIVGPTGANGVTIDAQGNSGVMPIDAGSVELDNLTFTGGHSHSGAGILNDGWLSINNCIIAGNSATGDGGSVANNGALSIANSAVVNNSAGGSGGGLVNYNVADEMIDSTFIDNTAVGSGGGIENQGLANVFSSTLVDNTSGGSGGGIDVNNGQSKIISSTFTGVKGVGSL